LGWCQRETSHTVDELLVDDVAAVELVAVLCTVLVIIIVTNVFSY
jgi:hypothetical protein